MIFVTVGTHEQAFNRLIREMDLIAKESDEEVLIQNGYSTYVPKYAKFKKFMNYEEMNENYGKARIIITHGGPSSFIDAVQIGKIPIVVPRQKKYGEHINNHQVDFCRKVEEKDNNIIVLLDEEKLGSTIKNYNEITKKMDSITLSHNKLFMRDFESVINKMFK